MSEEHKISIPEVPDVLNSPLTFGIEFEPGKLHYQTQLITQKYFIDGKKDNKKLSVTHEETMSHTLFKKLEKKNNLCASNIEFVFGIFPYHNMINFFSDDKYFSEEIQKEITENEKTLRETGDYKKLRFLKFVKKDEDDDEEDEDEDDDDKDDGFPKNSDYDNDYVNCMLDITLNDLRKSYDNPYKKEHIRQKYMPIEFVYEDMNIDKLKEYTGVSQITIGTNYAYLIPIFKRFSFYDVFKSSLELFDSYTRVMKKIEKSKKYIYEIFKGFILYIIYFCLVHETYHIKSEIEKVVYFKAMVLKPRSELYNSFLKLKEKYGGIFDDFIKDFKLLLEKRIKLIMNIEKDELIRVFNESKNRGRLNSAIFKSFKLNRVCGDKKLSDLYKDKDEHSYKLLLNNCVCIDLYYILLCIENPVECVYISDFGNQVKTLLKPGFYHVIKEEDDDDFMEIRLGLAGITFSKVSNSNVLGYIPYLDISFETVRELHSPMEVFELLGSDSNCIIEFRSPYTFIKGEHVKGKHYTLSNLNTDLVHNFFEILKKEYREYLNKLSE